MCFKRIDKKILPICTFAIAWNGDNEAFIIVAMLLRLKQLFVYGKVTSIRKLNHIPGHRFNFKSE